MFFIFFIIFSSLLYWSLKRPTPKFGIKPQFVVILFYYLQDSLPIIPLGERVAGAENSFI